MFPEPRRNRRSRCTRSRLYLRAARSTPLIDEILAAKPQRIILNPGAENDELTEAASSAGSKWWKAAPW